jgi:hypothetical protein
LPILQQPEGGAMNDKVKKFHDALDDVLDRPIAYNPAFRRITASTVAGIFLSQAWYWSKRHKEDDGWFYKTGKEWEEETGLTRSEQETARKHCLRVGVMEEKLKGIPATMYYRVVKNQVYTLLDLQIVDVPQTDQNAGNQQSDGDSNINKETEIPSMISLEQADFLKKAGLEWILLKGDVTINEIEQAITEAKRKELVKMFEKALGFSKPLPWWVGKEWTEFAEWVCDRHQESPTCFGEYNIWRNTPYTKGGMSNNRIRGFIKEFYDSWDMFVMAKNPAGIIGSVVQAVQSLVDQPDQDWRKGLNV